MISRLHLSELSEAFHPPVLLIGVFCEYIRRLRFHERYLALQLKIDSFQILQLIGWLFHIPGRSGKFSARIYLWLCLPSFCMQKLGHIQWDPNDLGDASRVWTDTEEADPLSLFWMGQEELLITIQKRPFLFLLGCSLSSHAFSLMFYASASYNLYGASYVLVSWQK